MGYSIEAFIGKEFVLRDFVDVIQFSKLISLHQEFALIPLSDDFYNAFNQNKTDGDIGSLLITSHIEEKVLTAMPKHDLAYIEADFFGGTGSQSAILWKNGKRVDFYQNSSIAINLVLASLGAKKVPGKDRFEAIGLNRHRSTLAWLGLD